MNLVSRFRHGVEPALAAGWFIGSVVLGLTVWNLASAGLICPVLSGSVVFSPALGVFAFFLANADSLGTRWSGWFKSAALQLLYVAVFVAATVVARLGLDAVELGGYPHLGFLTGHEVFWRIPASFFAGLVAWSMVLRFVHAPQDETFDGPNSDERVIRGPRFVSYIETKSRYLAKAGSEYVTFAFVNLPLKLARHGLLLLGAPGAGKTVLLLWLLMSFLRLVQKDSKRYRAIITPDPKNDYRAFIEKECAKSGAKTWLLHPFDQDSLAWDIAEDLTEDTSLEFATALFPRRSAATADGGFFDGTAIKDLAGLLNGFKAHFGNEWTLADVFERAATRAGMLEVLGWDASNVTNAQCIARYHESADTRLAENCFQTFAEKAEPYYTISAALREQWKRGQRFSFKRWRETGGVIVFGWSANHESQMKALHAAFIAMLRRALLSEPNSEYRSTLVMVDEGPSAGDIASEVDLLLREGRSRGVIVALALHNLAAMRSATRSRDECDAMLAEPQYFACLRLTDSETATWAARRLSGDGTEIERTQVTETTTPDDKGVMKKSFARLTLRETKQLVSPAQLIGSPTVDARDGIGPNGYANTDQGNVYPFHYLFSAMKQDLPQSEPFVPKPFDSSVLRLRMIAPASNGSRSERGAARKPKRPKPPVERKDDDDDGLPYRSA